MSNEMVNDQNVKMKDILFINGCMLDPNTRYRVDNQREQLSYENITSEVVFCDKLSIDLVKRFKVFIFFRCPHSQSVEAFIKTAKKLNKMVIYDIDELVIDKKYTETIKYLSTMSSEDKSWYDLGVERNLTALKMCDGVITVTDELANEIKQYNQNVFVNRNVVSDKLVKISKLENYYRFGLMDADPEYLSDEQKSILENMIKENNEKTGKVILGYFSGSITHNSDLDFISGAISSVLEKNSNVALKLVGEIDIPDSLKKYSDRIERIPFIHWEQLPKLISSVDINLAPLENTIYNQAKSEVNWLEASLVKVPTIASNIAGFKKCIEHNETGILCDTNEEWVEAIEKLISDEKLRKTIADNACAYVLKNCVTYSNPKEYVKYLKENYISKVKDFETKDDDIAELESIIDVRNVGIKFSMSEDKILSLKELFTAFLTHKIQMNDYWALKDISFNIVKGDVLGIVGRNGAGKSTLLKIISGIVGPTKGQVTVRGNIVPMLELGSGFDFDLTGRENVFLNGAILGYSKEFLKEKFDEIHEFSELGDFIDIPIRNYSSGMLMRLAFSIATVVEPEILIVDEILAVGDENFQRKSKKRMLELMSGGTTVLFVSHSMDQIREMCNKVVWIEKGVVKMFGDTETVCDAYSI